ncbi:MAG: hypothetical protein M3P98_00185 [bacterium]|nr:hypothetical protein [bacterium]
MGTAYEIGPEFDRPGEECGVVGFWFNDAGHDAIKNGEIDPYRMMYDALCSQANRGQQNTGIWSDVGLNDEHAMTKSVIQPGKPKKAFQKGKLLSLFAPDPKYLLGHNRYTTIGGESGGQPVEFGDLAIVHNGQFNDFPETDVALEHLPSDSWRWGAIVADDIDKGYTAAGAMIKNAELVDGSYSLLTHHRGEMIAMRDPAGNRPLMTSPLILGNVHIGWMAASEAPTLLAAGVDPYGDIQKVNAGELIVFNDDGLNRIQYAEPNNAYCAMEHVYLSRPTHGTEKVWLSNSEMGEVRAHRYQMGIITAEQHPIEYERGSAPKVVPILGSAEMGAQGFADSSDLEIKHWITKRNEDDRHFMRVEGERVTDETVLFFDPNTGEHVLFVDNHKIYIDRMEGEHLVLMDDSVVRGDTMKKIIAAIVKYGMSAKIDVRITSPPISRACSYGTDYQDARQLFANKTTRADFIDEYKIDSFEHIDLSGMQLACGKDPEDGEWKWGEKICDHCFGGDNSPASKKVSLIQKPTSVLS